MPCNPSKLQNVFSFLGEKKPYKLQNYKKMKLEYHGVIVFFKAFNIGAYGALSPIGQSLLRHLTNGLR